MRLTIHTKNRRKLKKAFQYYAFLDGVDVTSQCQCADDRQGRVLLLKVNADGQPFVDQHGDVAREWKRGRVELRRRDPGA